MGSPGILNRSSCLLVGNKAYWEVEGESNINKYINKILTDFAKNGWDEHFFSTAKNVPQSTMILTQP